VSDRDLQQVRSFGRLGGSEDTNRAWENIKGRIKTSGEGILGNMNLTFRRLTSTIVDVSHS